MCAARPLIVTVILCCFCVVRLPDLGGRALSWLCPLWSLGEDSLIRHTGLDAAVYMRFLRVGVYVFATATVVGFAILVPAHKVGFVGWL